MLSIREHRFPFLQKVGNWNRFTENTGGTLVEKCCHFFDLMLHIMQAKPVRVMASGGQDVNHLDEVYDGRRSDILDNAYIVWEFENGQRACMDICMFAEASRHQEEIACVGNYGKIEAFAPAHGAEADDETLPNFIIGQVNARHRSVTADPPPPVKPEEQHISIDKTLMEAGHHCGATFYELEVFSHVARQKGKAHVDVIDGLLAVAMGIAAHMAIDEQRIVRFSELGVDELWDQKHGNNKHQDVNGIGKVGSGQRLQEMQQVLPPDGEKQAQVDGWEISWRRQTSQCSQESSSGYPTT
jgi:predicted dehydrogenase